MPTLLTLKEAQKEWRAIHKGDLPPDDANARRRALYYNHPMWKSIRKQHLMKQPLDEVMLACGKVVPAKQCHHVVKWDAQETDERKMMLLTDDDNVVSVSQATHEMIHRAPEKLPREALEFLRAKREQIRHKYYDMYEMDINMKDVDLIMNDVTT